MFFSPLDLFVDAERMHLTCQILKSMVLIFKWHILALYVFDGCLITNCSQALLRCGHCHWYSYRLHHMFWWVCLKLRWCCQLCFLLSGRLAQEWTLLQYMKSCLKQVTEMKKGQKTRWANLLPFYYCINKRDNVVVSHPFFFFLQNNRDILLSWGLKLFFFLEFAYVLEMLSLLFVLISFIWH